MRIVSGSARGRRLAIPDGLGTRPTADRVKEALFNSLFSLGYIEGLAFCDLYAGTGSLGLEALSRGAHSVTFVENNRFALEVLRMNVAALGFSEVGEVVAGDAIAFLRRGARFDVILADPPYSDDPWNEIFELADAQAVVTESERPIGAAQVSRRWRRIREREYGTTIMTVFEQAEGKFVNQDRGR